jgi:3-methyladenine DNA glycosylase Tag
VIRARISRGAGRPDDGRGDFYRAWAAAAAFAAALIPISARAADRSLVADIRSVRSLVAEAAEIQSLSKQGALTGKYVCISLRQARDQLEALAKQTHPHSPELAHDIAKALKAIEDSNTGQLRALADTLTELDRHAAAD